MCSTMLGCLLGEFSQIVTFEKHFDLLHYYFVRSFKVVTYNFYQMEKKKKWNREIQFVLDLCRLQNCAQHHTVFDQLEDIVFVRERERAVSYTHLTLPTNAEV